MTCGHVAQEVCRPGLHFSGGGSCYIQRAKDLGVISASRPKIPKHFSATLLNMGIFFFKHIYPMTRPSVVYLQPSSLVILWPRSQLASPLSNKSLREHLDIIFFCFPPRCADFILYIIPGWTCWPPCFPRLHTPRILVSNLQKKFPPPSFRFSLFLCGKLSIHFNITHS